MSHELMIPDRAEVPAYIFNPELAKQANQDALAGISTGFPPRLKLAGKAFALVDGNGNETPYPPAKLVAGPDGNLYLPVIVLRAKAAIQKTFYMGAFNPSAEGSAPDCFSNDGIKPDPSAGVPQCDLCANCPQNAYGTAKDQNGNATNGKACKDEKILAVFVPNAGIHSFKITPASLKNWGLYVKQLSVNGIPLGAVKTLVGFDLTATYPVLVFQFGGWVPQEATEKLAMMAQSPEAEEIVSNAIKPSTKAAPQIAAPAPVQVVQPVVAPAPAPAPVAPVVVQVAPQADDLGLGIPEAPQAPPAAKRGRPAVVKTEAPQGVPVAPASAVSDDALRASLGIPGL